MTEVGSCLRIGLVGLGHVGSVHIEAIRRTPGLVLSACCDRDQRLRSLVPTSVPFYVDVARMLDDGGLDVIVIATPNETHERMVTICASSDVDIILEKPSAASIDGFDAISLPFVQQGRLLYHAHHAQHGLEMELLGSFAQGLDPDDLGPVTSFSCLFHDPYVDDSGVQERALSLGDSWVDSGINALSVLDRVIDLCHLELVHRTSGRLPTGGPVVQSMAQFRILESAPEQENGPRRVAGMGSIHTSWIDGEDRKRTWLLFGRSGIEVLLDHSGQSMEVREPGKPVRRLTSTRSQQPRLVNHYLGVFGEFIQYRRSGLSNARVARRILELLYGNRE